MPQIPDLTDPRYLDEVGWFLQYEDYTYGTAGGSYEQERLDSSALLCAEVLRWIGKERLWLSDKTVVSVGAGCIGDLAAWPAAVKIAIDPLLDVYDKLGMLIRNDSETTQTICLSSPIDDVPLVDRSADLLLCRNALDHMPDPEVALEHMWRLLRPDGVIFASVDIGGQPTPDEPTVFKEPELLALLEKRFEFLDEPLRSDSHSVHRDLRVSVAARKKDGEHVALDKYQILSDYQDRVEATWGPGSVWRNPKNLNR